MTARTWSVGVNYTSAGHISTLAALMDAGCVHHVEILIDNFLTVPAQSVLDKFGDTPVAFHIMFSRFLEADREALLAMAAPLRELIRIVKPLYVSDHVGHFSYEGRAMPIVGEYDYRRLEHAVGAVDQWQTMLGTRLLLENFPSYTSRGTEQLPFFERVLDRTGAGLLFDISNAVVAAHNACVPVEAWNDLIEGCNHFHLGGYSQSNDDPHILLDTHDCGLSTDTMATAARIFSNERAAPTTLTVEFDRNIEVEVWARDLRWAAGLDRTQIDASSTKPGTTFSPADRDERQHRLPQYT